MSRKQPISMFLLAGVSLVEDLVILVTLGFYDPGWRGKLLFDCLWYDALASWEAK